MPLKTAGVALESIAIAWLRVEASQEALAGLSLSPENFPDLKIRFINGIDLLLSTVF
jgi:hypothetical protein